MTGFRLQETGHILRNMIVDNKASIRAHHKKARSRNSMEEIDVTFKKRWNETWKQVYCDKWAIIDGANAPKISLKTRSDLFKLKFSFLQQNPRNQNKKAF